MLCFTLFGHVARAWSSGAAETGVSNDKQTSKQSNGWKPSSSSNFSVRADTVGNPRPPFWLFALDFAPVCWTLTRAGEKDSIVWYYIVSYVWYYGNILFVYHIICVLFSDFLKGPRGVQKGGSEKQGQAEAAQHIDILKHTHTHTFRSWTDSQTKGW